MTRVSTYSFYAVWAGPVWSGWPPKLFGYSFSHCFHIHGVRAHSADTLEFPLLLSCNSVIGHRDFVGISFAYWEALVGSTVLLVVVLAALVLAAHVVGIEASFSCSLFLLYSSYGVGTTYDWGASALDFTTPWLHLPPVVATTQTG